MPSRSFLPLALAAAILVSGCAGTRAQPDPQPGPGQADGPIDVLSGNSTKTVTEVVSYDGHRIPITLYRPVEATPDEPVPLILHSHGWAGTRTTADDAFRDYHRAGFAVLSIDMRGHGQARSTSAAQIHHMDYEIKDVREVITWAARLDWIAHETPEDPLVGAIGGSYGGAYQLLAAATDARLDAIAPEITWSDVVQSLVPNGAIRSAWIDLLYAGGNANARLHPNIHQGFATAQTMNRIPDGSLPGEYDLEGQLRRSSPASYPDAIQIPTLIIQGVNDTLFNLNQAVANYDNIRATGADVRLVTHLGGHILNTRGTIPLPAPQPIGLQPPTGGSPCGSPRNLTIAFHQVHLSKRRVDLGPRVCLALEDATHVEARDFPPRLAKDRTFTLGSVQIAQPVERFTPALRILEAGPDGMVLAGIPRVQATATTSGQAILFYRLEAAAGDTTRTLNAQVTPHRLVADGKISFDLGGIGARLRPGETLYLTITSDNEQFAHNGGRTPAIVRLDQVSLELPILTGP